MQTSQLGQETNTLTATKQAVNGRDENGRFAIGNKPAVGFHTNPERRNDGRWRKEGSITYQYKHMLAMTDDEFEAFTPKTKAQKIVRARIMRAMRDDDNSLAETKEITDRTEGRPRQDIGAETEENTPPLIKGFVIPTLPDGYIDKQIAKARIKSVSSRSS